MRRKRSAVESLVKREEKTTKHNERWTSLRYENLWQKIFSSSSSALCVRAATFVMNLTLKIAWAWFAERCELFFSHSNHTTLLVRMQMVMKSWRHRSHWLRRLISNHECNFIIFNYTLINNKFLFLDSASANSLNWWFNSTTRRLRSIDQAPYMLSRSSEVQKTSSNKSSFCEESRAVDVEALRHFLS